MWHFHPEYQLTLVLESRGHRMVGDNITRCGPAISCSSARIFRMCGTQETRKLETECGNAERNRVHAIIVRFLDTFLGSRVSREAGDGARARSFCAKAGARTADHRAHARPRRETRCIGSPPVSGLARIANCSPSSRCSRGSRDVKPVASAGFVPRFSHARSGADASASVRLHRSPPHRLIDRTRVAAEAHLSPGAFSRFFKLRTGRTLPGIRQRAAHRPRVRDARGGKWKVDRHRDGHAGFRTSRISTGTSAQSRNCHRAITAAASTSQPQDRAFNESRSRAAEAHEGVGAPSPRG